MRSTILRLLSSIVVVAVVVLIVALRGLSWTDNIGVVLPKFDLSLLWLAIWPVWMLISEKAARAAGIPEPERWDEKDSRGLLGLRLVAIAIFAPLAEELMFRGLLFDRFAESPFGMIGAVGIPALAFSLLHLQYGWRERLWILLDGLLFGLARLHSGSVLFPVIMHMMGNVHAYYQRLPR